MPPSATEGEPAQRPAVPSKALGRFALALAVCWIASLAAIAICTSNPVTLNREQVLLALERGVVVRARVMELQTGRCETIEQWPTERIGQSFQVTNLVETEARPGETYLLPLLPGEDGHVIARSPGGQQQIYPDTPAALTQLEELLTLSPVQRSAQTGVNQAH